MIRLIFLVVEFERIKPREVNLGPRLLCCWSAASGNVKLQPLYHLNGQLYRTEVDVLRISSRITAFLTCSDSDLVIDVPNLSNPKCSHLVVIQ